MQDYNKCRPVCWSVWLVLTGLIIGSFAPSRSSAQCVADFTYAIDSNGVVSFTNNSVGFDTSITTYIWDFGDSTFSQQENPVHVYPLPLAFQVCLTVSDSACFDISCDTIMICLDECIWPGDANQDGIANYLDLVPMGLAFGSVSNSGPNIFLNNNWQEWLPFTGMNWMDTLPGGQDLKYVDADGNGTIGFSDTVPLAIHYSKMHQVVYGRKASAPCDPGTPPLYFHSNTDTLREGDTVSLELNFGTPSEPVNSVYALTFTFNFDTSIIKYGSAHFKFSDSWMGQTDSLLTIARVFDNQGAVEAAIVRTNQKEASGDGVIGQFIIVMEDNLEGKALLDLEFAGAFEAYDRTYRPLDICPEDKNIPVGPKLLAGKKEAQHPESRVNLFPNPNHGVMHVSWGNIDVHQISVTNTIGQELLLFQMNEKANPFTLDLSTLSNGLYFLTMKTDAGKSVVKKFTISR